MATRENLTHVVPSVIDGTLRVISCCVGFIGSVNSWTNGLEIDRRLHRFVVEMEEVRFRG